jgi:hypothetical protein
MSLGIRKVMTSFCLQPKARRSTSIKAGMWVFAAICILWNAVPPVFPEEPSGALSQVRPGGITDANLDARVESLLRTMNLDEKVGQLVQYSAGQATGPGTGRTDYEDMIARGQIGSLLNVVDPREINKYQRIAMEKARLHNHDQERTRNVAVFEFSISAQFLSKLWRTKSENDMLASLWPFAPAASP